MLNLTFNTTYAIITSIVQLGALWLLATTLFTSLHHRLPCEGETLHSSPANWTDPVFTDTGERQTWTPEERQKIRRICQYFVALILIGGGFASFWGLDLFRQDHTRTWFGAWTVFRTHPRATIDIIQLMLGGMIVLGAALLYRVSNYVPEK